LSVYVLTHSYAIGERELGSLIGGSAVIILAPILTQPHETSYKEVYIERYPERREYRDYREYREYRRYEGERLRYYDPYGYRYNR
jgi:hypothetical protein